MWVQDFCPLRHEDEDPLSSGEKTSKGLYSYESPEEPRPLVGPSKCLSEGSGREESLGLLGLLGETRIMM